MKVKNGDKAALKWVYAKSKKQHIRLMIQKRKLEENRYLMGSGCERALSLIGEARQVGLIDSMIQIDYQD